MKKILLALAISIVLVCLFAVGVSANDFSDVVTKDTFDTTGMSTDTTSRVVLDNGDGTYTTYPSQYIVKSSAELEFDFTQINDLFTKSYKNSNIVRLEVPTTVTKVPEKNSGAPLKGIGIVYIDFKADSLTLCHNAMHSCTKLVEVHLPADTTFERNYQFNGCSSLTTVKCPGGLKTLSAFLFYGCKNLTSLDIDWTQITNVPSNAFNGCTSLVMEADLSNVGDIGESAFYSNKMTFVNANNITSVGKNAFRNCKGMTKITLAEGLTTIGSYAFNNSNIASIVFPASLQELGGSSFVNTPIKSVEFLNEGTDITFGSDIFKNVDTLETVIFKKNAGITSLGVFMFYDCDKLKYLSIPDSVTTINSGAFYGCGNLGPLYLPKNLTTVSSWDNLFEYGTKMYFVNEFFTDPEAVEKPSVYYFPNLITELPSEVEIFKQCQNLNETIVFGDKLTAVKDGYAFAKKSGDTVNNFVFLGNMTEFKYYGTEFVNTNLYFCNPNTKAETLTFSAHKDSTNATNCKVFICSEGKWADLSTREFTNDMTKEDHVRNPLADAYVPATCTEAAKDAIFCFCGKELGAVIDEENPARGHIYDNIIDFYYKNNNYYELATGKYACPQCQCDVERAEENSNLFVMEGYTAAQYGDGALAFGMSRNDKAFELYAEYVSDLKYGLVVSLADTTAPITGLDGNNRVTVADKTVAIPMDGNKYTRFTVKVSGLASDEATLICCGYVYDNGDVTYLGHGKASKDAEVISRAKALAYESSIVA